MQAEFRTVSAAHRPTHPCPPDLVWILMRDDGWTHLRYQGAEHFKNVWELVEHFPFAQKDRNRCESLCLFVRIIQKRKGQGFTLQKPFTEDRVVLFRSLVLPPPLSFSLFATEEPTARCAGTSRCLQPAGLSHQDLQKESASLES